jgi:cytochrome c peroxidase
MKYFLIFGTFILVIALTAGFCGKTPRAFIVPPNWPESTYDFKSNPLTVEGVELGRVLFYDPILSSDNSISCANCHSPYNAFTHVDHALSHGIHDRIGKRNSPALMNLAWYKEFMWDGAIHNLDVQPLAPITHADEMGSNINDVISRLKNTELYPKLFHAAFDTDEITGEYMLKAMSQFMLTLVSCDSKYDRMKRNEIAFNEQELHGYGLFINHCSACHKEPLFTTNDFVNNGLPMDSSLHDHGRMNITQNSKDDRKFKIPTLRNVEFTAPYMHDGRFRKLSAAIEHYTSGIQVSETLDSLLSKPMNLTKEDQVDLLTFLLTLSDRKFLFDDSHSFPKKYFLE